MTFNFILVALGLVWILTLLACAVSVRWTFIRARNRHLASCILSGVSLVVGLVGIMKFSLVVSRTSNGVVQWRLDSSWLFWISIVCGLLSLLYAVFSRWSEISR